MTGHHPWPPPSTTPDPDGGEFDGGPSGSWDAVAVGFAVGAGIAAFVLTMPYSLAALVVIVAVALFVRSFRGT